MSAAIVAHHGPYVATLDSHADAVSVLSSSEQREMQRIVEQKQMKDFMRLYTGLVERCFDSCVNDFTSKAPTNKELTCVGNCTQKFFKHSERVGARFGEEKCVCAASLTQRPPHAAAKVSTKLTSIR